MASASLSEPTEPGGPAAVSRSAGGIYKILGNPIYAGRLAHKAQVHDGQHEAIIDEAVWDRVQEQLASNTRRREERQLSSEHLLTGKIRDEHGTTLTPTHAQRELADTATM